MSCVTERRTRDQHAFSEADSFPVPQFFTPDVSSNLKCFASQGFLEPCKFKSHQAKESLGCHERTEFPEEYHSLRSERFFRKLEQLLMFLRHLNEKLLRFNKLSIPKIITQNSNPAALDFQESSPMLNMDLELVNISVDTSGLVLGDTCEICKSEMRSLGGYNVENFSKADFEVEPILWVHCVRKGGKRIIAPKFMRSEERVRENDTSIPQSFIFSVCVAVITLIANFLAVMSINKKPDKLKRNINSAAPLTRLSMLFTVLFMFQILPLTCTTDPLGNPYEILGVTRHATLQDIRKAYKLLVKEW